MKKYIYAWARAFPRVFIPTYEYDSEKERWEWIIWHDITGWKWMREKAVDPK